MQWYFPLSVAIVTLGCVFVDTKPLQGLHNVFGYYFIPTQKYLCFVLDAIFIHTSKYVHSHDFNELNQRMD